MVSSLSLQPPDIDRIAAITARLDLRVPNREALETLAVVAYEYFEVDREPPPLEAVIDSATGVGKTFILASALEYFAGEGMSDFVVITPGRTILEKTVANFTAGHPKSLLGGMETHPVVITADNFATPVMRSAMEDPQQIKLYVFTVQALIRPQSKAGRRTHKFQEGLGSGFYEHLQSIPNLMVFADEHHAYYGKAFSGAVRDLRPRILVGLTATPHKQTPRDQIIYAYPLAAAIADRLVKTPVLVGRRDDLSDPRTKLLDGVRLLELKEQLIRSWCAESGAEPINPIMLVISPSIVEAEEIDDIVSESSFAGGRYAGKVLTVHSSAPDEALAQLERLEEPDSPYRIVVSVGMLKEGWDVKNVYVVASLRASVSEILTEQTLGRGLRLPFGRYTGIELLDTLEVLGHERYEELLKRAGILNEQFVDLRTRAVLRRNARGELEVIKESTLVQAPIITLESVPEHASPAEAPAVERPTAPAGVLMIASVAEQTWRAEQEIVRLQSPLPPLPELPPLRIPRLRMTPVTSSFSLADITDLSMFRRLGERFAIEPAGTLRRMRLSARIVEGRDGLRSTELTTALATDRVESQATLEPLDALRDELLNRLLHASIVPARKNQRYPAGQIVDAFVSGLGSSAMPILSAYMDRAAAGLIDVVADEQRKVTAKPTFDEVVEIVEFHEVRRSRVEVSQDRYGAFRKGVGYQGFRKSIYAQDWFDSSTERAVANILDDSDEIEHWVRLQPGDLPILWSGAREYNPDLIAVDLGSDHWLIEVKMDREMHSDEVQGKRTAAQRWANYVSADASVGNVWRYLLVSETDVSTAKGSWSALASLGAM